MQYGRPGPGRTRAGASALALALAAAGPVAGTAHAEGTVLGSFEDAFNNTAVTPASASGENPNSPDFGGVGNSCSGALLSAAGWEPGAPITVNGTVCTWPRATRDGDNAKAVGRPSPCRAGATPSASWPPATTVPRREAARSRTPTAPHRRTASPWTAGHGTPVTEDWTPTETVVGDFTGDGKADIVARDADGTLKIRTGRGDATFDGPRVAPVRW
ncbi:MULTISPECIES: VCBS repeat-containing protein [unclassified Streptomyces]|uniref:FG-GAP repeat domain-containing protein n=1 Tax=unclassified Streptomyces TaxID=2593676 RepID=UPI0033B8309D